MSDTEAIKPVTTDRGLDYVIIEEPLSLRIGGAALTLMRTPGHERELAAGFCLSEGIITSLSDVLTVSYCESGETAELNTIDVRLRDDIVLDQGKPVRAIPIRSSCGLCGGKMIDDILSSVNAGAEGSPVCMKRSVLTGLPEIMRKHQPLFAKTGAAHAAAFFSTSGNLIVCREDIGRHNALDKAMGHLLLNKIDIYDKVLMLSGRVSYEMVAKAYHAGCRIMAAVSAPTSLAVKLAEKAAITLIGFLRGDKMNVYTHPERLQ